MANKNVSFFLVGMVTGLILAVAGFSLFIRSYDIAGDDTIVLRLGHGLDLTHPVHKGMEYMAERLREKSAGTIEIRIFPGGVLGSETQNVEQLQRGALSMTKVSAATLESFVPQMAVFSLPYVFRDEQHYWSALEGSFGDKMLKAVEGHDLRGLCYYDAGARSFYSRSGPILEPYDLAGKNIRVMESSTAMSMIEAFGGSPTPTAWGELYTALQQGMVDGAENNPPTFHTSSHYEVCKYLSLNEHARIPDILVIGQHEWNRLTPDMQQWLQEAADESSIYQRELWRQATEKALAAVEERGVEIFYPEQEPFREKVQPLIKGHEGTAVGELISEIQEVEYDQFTD